MYTFSVFIVDSTIVLKVLFIINILNLQTIELQDKIQKIFVYSFFEQLTIQNLNLEASLKNKSVPLESHSCQPSKPKIKIIKVENSDHKIKNRNKNLFSVSECSV